MAYCTFPFQLCTYELKCNLCEQNKLPYTLAKTTLRPTVLVLYKIYAPHVKNDVTSLALSF